MKRVFVATAISAAFAAFAPAVMAQSVQSEPLTIIAAAPAADAGTARPAGERRFRSAAERVEARLAYIRTALKITDAQQPQWDAFANVLRNHARAMDERMQQRRAQGAQRDPRTVTAIERMERMQVRMQERYHRLGEVINAAKPLYAALSPEQKQAADEMIARGGRGGHHRHGGQRGA